MRKIKAAVYLSVEELAERVRQREAAASKMPAAATVVMM